MIRIFLKKLILPLFVTFIFSTSITYFFLGKMILKNNQPLNDQEIVENNKVASPAPASQEPKTPISVSPITREIPTSEQNSGYKYTIATFFWVGEPADESNDFIPNHKSSWDGNWQESFGGVDDPEDRCDFHPCKFTPKENPFYFALPYNDLDNLGNRKESSLHVPWFETYKGFKTILKNRWIEIKFGETICYAQWQDVGPHESDDFNYVFGNSESKNTLGVKAGIDLSPAVRDCLEMKTNGRVGWKFISDDSVPDGPWKRITTESEAGW